MYNIISFEYTTKLLHVYMYCEMITVCLVNIYHYTYLWILIKTFEFYFLSTFKYILQYY